MLDNKRVSVVSESIIEGNRVATFAAVLDLDKLEFTTTARYVDGNSYQKYKDYVRSDMEEFEHLMRDIQDMMPLVESEDDEESCIQTSFDEVTEEAIEE